MKYTVKGNKTAADAVANNDEILETGYTELEAKLAAISYQRDFGYAAAWIEEEAGEPAPRPAGASEITYEEMKAVATERQRTAVANHTMHAKLRGDDYKLFAEGKDILVDDGKIWRVDRKGKVTWDESPASV